MEFLFAGGLGMRFKKSTFGGPTPSQINPDYGSAYKLNRIILSLPLFLQQPGTVDLKIMSTFADFYTTLLGFVNFRLYNSINLHYPPKVSLGQRIESLEWGVLIRQPVT